MNKKFSTLMAGLLLAGGVLSPAMADQLSSVVGNGKYYKMERGAYIDLEKTSPSWTKEKASGRFLGLNSDETPVLVQNGAGYWKVEAVEGGFKFVNLEGKELKVNGNAVFNFYEEQLNGTAAEGFTQLYQGSTTWIGYDKATFTLETQDERGVAYDAVATNLAVPNRPSKELADKLVFKFVTVAEDGKGWNYSNLYVATEDPNTKGTFSFTENGTGTALYVEGEGETENDFKPVKCDGGYLLQTPSGKYVAYDGKFALVSELENASIFAFLESWDRALTANQLKYYEENGFSVTIKGQNETTGAWNVALKDNYFTGHLTPMAWDSNNKKFVAATTQDVFYVKNGNGKYIVALADLAEGSWQNAYAFTEVSEDALKRDMLKAGQQKYFAQFQFYYNEKEDLTAIKDITYINVYDYKYNYKGYVGRLDFKKEAYLAVQPNGHSGNVVVLKPVQIKLGGDNLADWKKVLAPTFFTVKYDGKILAATDCGEWAWVTSVDNVLEEQWALTYENGKYVFVNREHNVIFNSIAENALYEAGTKTDHVYSWKGKKLEINPVETTDADGYTRLGSTVDLLNKKFNIAFYSGVYGGNAWFTEEHSTDHTIALSTDIDDASVWTATAHNAARRFYEDKYVDMVTPSDSIYVIRSLGYWNADDEVQDYVSDTLKVVTYSFTNQYNEQLWYDADKNTFFANKEKKDGKFVAAKDKDQVGYFFALREEGDKLNLRLVEPWTIEAMKVADLEEGDVLHQTSFDVCGDKMYAGDTKEGMLNKTALFSRTENDLFVIEETDKPMYRRVVNPLDTISIFRNDNEKSVLFEDKHFLGMENIAQFPQIASGMVADTAYVRYNTYRPQYMLVVGPKVTPAGKYCPVHGVGADCKDEHLKDVDGWVEGRYLVNLVDTAIAWDKANKHKVGNPYINSENYYRLGFVQATHIKDTLIIASDNKKIIVGNDGYNQAKFAFRYDDQAAGSFRIETANYKRLPGIDKVEKDGEGWLKWMNGVVVVVDKIEDADIFNMDEKFEGQPTDNKTIATSEVTVIAGEGQVTIAGAAGKKVVISNILGQVVANTVLASDNAVIAAPQGVVVVAVEGEEAVKAIVK